MKQFELDAFMRSARPRRYIRGKLTCIGKGSARIVYALNDKLVIKLAWGKGQPIQAGYSQNKTEAKVSADPKSKGVVARVVAAHPRYHWVISERGYCLTEVVRLDYKAWRHLRDKHLVLEDCLETRTVRGKRVVIDYGLSDECFEKYYSMNALRNTTR